MLLATIVVARMLGKAVYGEFGMIRSTIDMFVVFAGFGLGLTATKHVAEFRRSDPERAGRIIALSWLVAAATGGVMALTLYGLAPWLAGHTINAPHLTGVLRVGALCLFVNALNGAQTGVLAGFEAFRTIACVNLLVGLISFPILVGGAYHSGLTGATWAMAATLAIHWLLNHLALRKEARRWQVPLSFTHCIRELSVLWKFSLPAVLAGMMIGPVRWTCNALLANQPHGYSELGIFSAALVFQQLALSGGEMLNTPLLSILSNVGTRSSEKLQVTNILSSWILGVAVAIPLLCFPEIPQRLFGADFGTRGFTVTFALVVFCTTVMAFKAGLARVLAANGLLWWGFLSNVSWAAVLVGSAVFSVRWGAPGLAVAFVAAYVVNTVILVPLYQSRKLVPGNTLLSFDSGLIWLVLVSLVFLSFVDMPLRFRVVGFASSVLLCGMSFIRLMKPFYSGTTPGTTMRVRANSQ